MGVDAAPGDEAEQMDGAAALAGALERGHAALDSRRSEPSRTAAFTRCRSWKRIRPEPIVRCPTSELPICPGGSPTAPPEAASVVCGYSRQSRSKTGVRASSTAFPGPRRRAAPAVEDDERYEVDAARQIAAKESGSSEAPPTRAPSIEGCESSSAAFSGLTEPP